MDIDKFRIWHSIIIEQYQFIEFHLEGIYALICGKNFMSGLADVEKSSISMLVRELKKMQSEKQIAIFSHDDFEKLEHICTRRNFWCHNCYVDMIFDSKTDAPKKDSDIELLMEDMEEAKELREYLYQKKMKLFRQNHL